MYKKQLSEEEQKVFEEALKHIQDNEPLFENELALVRAMLSRSLSKEERCPFCGDLLPDKITKLLNSLASLTKTKSDIETGQKIKVEFDENFMSSLVSILVRRIHDQETLSFIIQDLEGLALPLPSLLSSSSLSSPSPTEDSLDAANSS